MLLGSPPDMVHRAPAHGAHIRMQNSAIYSPVRFKYYTIPFGKLQVVAGGLGRKVLLSFVSLVLMGVLKIIFIVSYYVYFYSISQFIAITPLPRGQKLPCYFVGRARDLPLFLAAADFSV